MNVSRYCPAIPALPPKFGCMVCGAGHNTSFCHHNAALNLSLTERREVRRVQEIRDRRAEAARRATYTVRTPEETAAYYDRLSEAVNADQDDTNARARRRMGVGR